MVDVGLTDWEDRPSTEPRVLIVKEAEVPETDHDNVLDWPAVMLEAEALNEFMVGAGGGLGAGGGVITGTGVTVTVTLWFAEPPLLLAVKA